MYEKGTLLNITSNGECYLRKCSRRKFRKVPGKQIILYCDTPCPLGWYPGCCLCKRKSEFAFTSNHLSMKLFSLAFPVSHFRVALSPASQRVYNLSFWSESTQIEIIFIWKVMQLDSFWNRYNNFFLFFCSILLFSFFPFNLFPELLYFILRFPVIFLLSIFPLIYVSLFSVHWDDPLHSNPIPSSSLFFILDSSRFMLSNIFINRTFFILSLLCLPYSQNFVFFSLSFLASLR